MKLYTLCLLLLIASLSCVAQKNKKTTTMKTTERFDVQYYKSIIKKKNSYEGATSAQYVERNGTETYVSFNDDGFVLQEIKPFTYEMIVKNYYKNSIIKSKGKFLCHSSVKIGIWREYDNQGNLIKETDEDKKFEKLRLKPINILRWLEKEGYIDRKTGKGQEKFVKEGDEPNIDIYFWLSTRAEGSKTIPVGWSIDITEHGMCTTHSFNAETGEYLGNTTQVVYE
ncbi:hypothetical protein CRM71_12595 [Prevotella jejuni]|uniref:Uncharacterized protein n=1 Tax=Prevotella jejuni TaxID=1177574 RepID=A0A2K9HH70_9BACT|nr:hypothetical protein CRM71_12595 [Prevotella jejuni]SNR78797.1 hypothetical protein SAMN06265364_11089 [Prevotella jejuni]